MPCLQTGIYWKNTAMENEGMGQSQPEHQQLQAEKDLQVWK